MLDLKIKDLTIFYNLMSTCVINYIIRSLRWYCYTPRYANLTYIMAGTFTVAIVYTCTSFYWWFNIDAGFQFNIVISVIARVINMHIVSFPVICLWYAHRLFSAGYNFQKMQLGNTGFNFVCVCSYLTELMPLFSLVFVSCTDICIEIHIDIV